MGLFGRKKQSETEPDDAPEVAEVTGEPGVDRDWDRAVDGPHDISEQPDLGPRVDFGTLRLPAVQGMDLRLEVNKSTKAVTSVTLVIGGSQVQIQAFAAPRSSGLWREIRTEIAESLREKGGTADEVPSLFGVDLLARMPSSTSDGRQTQVPVRFLGVDGPRWFLRVVVNGPAAAQEQALKPILALVRRIVVTRDDEARPPREVLPINPPAQVLERITGQLGTGGTTAAGAPAGDSSTGTAGTTEVGGAGRSAIQGG